MAHGATHCYTEDLCRRFNSICIQEKQNSRSSWPWWTHSQYSHLHFRKQRSKKSLLKDIPVPNCLERGVPPGRLTRREYKIRLLEARYPRGVWRDAAESAKYFECGYEDVCCKSPGSFLRDKPSATGVGESKAGASSSKSSGDSDRRVVDDSICCKVFQRVGSDLIAPWLTPNELCSVEMAMGCSWDWAQAWHHGRVRNKVVASRVEYGLSVFGVAYLLEVYHCDDVFSALWHLIPVEVFSCLAHKYKHLKSIRKLMHLRS